FWIAVSVRRFFPLRGFPCHNCSQRYSRHCLLTPRSRGATLIDRWSMQEMPAPIAADTIEPTDGVLEHCGSHVLARHLVTTQDQEQVALHRVEAAGSDQTRLVVVLLHGAFTNRRFWLSRRGKGLAAYLANAGCDVWILETRGHGVAVRSSRYRGWTARDVARHDIPAASDYIYRATNGRKQTWIAHSYGGIYLMASLSMGWLDQSKLSSAAIFGSQLLEGQAYLKLRPLNWLIRTANSLYGRFPARLFGMGSEDEPPGIMNEALSWKLGEWISCQGEDYARGLAQINIPVLAAGGVADTMDPAGGCQAFWELIGSRQKHFWRLGKEQGWLKDYGHVDMLIGREASTEVWPKLLQWLEQPSAKV